MRNNDGEKIAKALLCMCISKAGSLDILKEPQKAVTLINEYANGGFYRIQKLIDNGENDFNNKFFLTFPMPCISSRLDLYIFLFFVAL